MNNESISNNTINEPSEKGISLKEIIHIIKKHFLAIFLFVVIGIGAGVGYSMVEAPEFVASGSLIAMPEAIKSTTAAEYNGMSMVSDTFVSFVTENVVLERVAYNLNNDPEYAGRYQDVTAGMVRSGMSVSNTNLIIKVRYSSNDGVRSVDFTKAIINGVVEVANDKITVDGKVQNKYNLLAGNLQDLSIPKSAGRLSHTSKNLLVGGAIGVVIAAAYTIVFELLDNSFRSESEVELELGMPVLSVVPIYDIDNEVKKKGGNN